ncbi:MAG: helix-turn-helix transcriptional regulator [Bacteroidota bacterium]
MIKAHQQLDLFNRKVFEKAVVEAPFRVVGEFPDEACFYYLVEGEAEIYAPVDRISMKRQEGVVMQCGTYLNEFLASQEGRYCEAIAVHLYPDVLKSIYDKDLPDFLLNVNQVKPIVYQTYQASALMKTYVDSLQFYFEHPELVSEELLKLKVKELVLLLAKTDNLTTIQMLFEGLFNKAAMNFMEVIEANIFNNLGLEELASLSGLSLSSFKREFEKHYDCSPAKYIKKRKLMQAAKLLRGTDLRVSDIAYDSGFNDLAHFSKSFQKEFGASPTDFRVNVSDNSLDKTL